MIAELRADLARLVAFPTVSSRPVTELAAHLAQRAEDLGFVVERFAAGPDKASVVATIGPDTGAEGLVLSGHMDVVPTDGQPWTSDPFVLTDRDERWIGRGTADMKGFVAAVYQALARIDRRELRRRLALVWTHDEEIGCLGSAMLAEALAGRTLPRACWIGEPTELRVQRMHAGHVILEVTVGGRAAHSSRPELGSNAVVAMAQVVGAAQALAEELASRRDRDLAEVERPWVTLNVAEIAGGTAVNVVPDRCVLRIGYRPLPGHDPEAVHRELTDRIAALGLPNPVASRVLRVTPALLTAEGTPLQHELAPHAAHPGCGAATFATDGGNLARLGLRPLIFGPGSIAVAHQADEFVPAGELAQTVGVVEAVVRRMCCG